MSAHNLAIRLGTRWSLRGNPNVKMTIREAQDVFDADLGMYNILFGYMVTLTNKPVEWAPGSFHQGYANDITGSWEIISKGSFTEDPWEYDWVHPSPF